MFDIIVMVDWSSSAEPCREEDSVWIAWGEPPRQVYQPINPATRQEALQWLATHLQQWAAERKKILLCFDFAYGYPTGLADLLGLNTPPNQAWMNVWVHLHELAFGPVGGGDMGNGLNKFAMAQNLNAAIQANGAIVEGPFWGRTDWTTENATLAQLPAPILNAPPFCRGGRKGGGDQRRNILAQRGIVPANFASLKMTSPGFPILIPAGGQLNSKRVTESRAAGAQETWHIFGGPGVVGGQVLAGIPYLRQLVNDAHLQAITRIWPFQTGFADPTTNADRGCIVHAEMFPSALDIRADIPPVITVKDARQVWTLVRHTLELDANGNLLQYFQQPRGLTSIQLTSVVQEEGWILFVK